MPEFRPVLFVIGALLCGLAGGMLLPAAADALQANPEWQVFVGSALPTGFAGTLLVLANRGRGGFTLNLRQGFLLTSLSWLVLAAFAALPFAIHSGGLTYTDAFFEAISGLTTTGSTVLVGLDQLPPGVLLWRSILQWLGGMGIIAMAILLLPFLRVGGMQLFRAESSDRSDKVVSRPWDLAAYIGLVYLGLTAACAVSYRLAGMNGFDAVNHAMTTLATGGYSTHDASFGYFANPAVQWVGIVFMLAGGLPFVAYIRTLRGKQPVLWRDSQVQAMLGILAAASAVLVGLLWIVGGQPLLDSLRLVLFNVISIVTTTGFVSTDYQSWGPLSAGVFFLLAFVGGCTGSTAGGIKVFRFQVLWIVGQAQLRQLLQPHRMTPATYGGRILPDDIAPSVLAFLFVFVGSAAFLSLGLTAFGLDLVTSLSGAVQALSNVGPGLGPIIGPAGNYATLPDGAKWLLSAGMLLGRLELFTIIILFQPAFWRW
ncbi:MAG TPA: TrkH family potassium uptake protein [Kiloniellales bacterium]|jgi:trk system potassium uptake protein TrkH